MFSLLTGAESQASGAANQSLFYTLNAKPQLSDAAAQAPQEAIGDGQTPGGGVAAANSKKMTSSYGSDRVLQGTLRLDYLRPSGSQ